jgi:hypothetical protein
MAPDGIVRTCVDGDMQLSVHLHTSLTEAIAKTEFELTGELNDSAKEDGWHCPRCSNRMVGTIDHQKGSYHLEQFCRACGFVLTSNQVYQLIKRHPHT